MKKILVLIIIVVSMFGLVNITGCENEDKGEISVVCTIFPEYDWTREIVKDVDGISVKLLLDSGVDLHSYQPSVQDITSISTCDLFIYVGGESDRWVDSALKNAKNNNRKTIKLLDVLSERVKEEEIIEGMQEEDEGEEGEEEETEYDEHVWLSLKNANIVCKAIANALVEIDEVNKETYLKNLSEYTKDLLDLDKLYEQVAKYGNKDTLLFADRFPFRYLVDDYNLKYCAAFVGCSTESAASFETITFLANKVDELGLSVILTLEGNNHNIAQTVKSSSKTKNQTILVMDSLQSITKKDLQSGVTYLSVMQENLEVLTEALK